VDASELMSDMAEIQNPAYTSDTWFHFSELQTDQLLDASVVFYILLLYVLFNE